MTATTVPIIKIFYRKAIKYSLLLSALTRLQDYKIINYKINNAVIRKIISTKR